MRTCVVTACPNTPHLLAGPLAVDNPILHRGDQGAGEVWILTHKWLVTSVPEPPLRMQWWPATNSCHKRVRSSMCQSLSHRVQAVTLDLRIKLLQDALAQRLPELWCDKMRQLHVRVVFVCALWQYIIVQGGALLAFQ